MIRDTHLKKYIYRTKKHYDRKNIRDLLGCVRQTMSVTSDCSLRTKNAGNLEDSLPFAEIPFPSRVRVDSFSQVTGSLNLGKADGKKIAVMYAVLAEINKRCQGEVIFRLNFSNVSGAGEAHITLRSDEARLVLQCISNCREKAAINDKLKSLQEAVILFESATKSHGKFEGDFKRISSAPGTNYAFSKVQLLPIDSVEETIAHLISIKPPPAYKHDLIQLYLTEPESWAGEDFNRNIRMVNENAGCFKYVTLICAWSPAKWEEYEVLEDLYGLFGAADTDACLFEFTLPSGKAGMTAMTYGKKGFRLYVSFDEATAIKEFEKLTGVKCEVF